MSQLVVPDQLVAPLYQRSYIYNKYTEQRSFGLRLCEAALTGTQDKGEQSCRPKGLATTWPVDTWRYRHGQYELGYKWAQHNWHTARVVRSLVTTEGRTGWTGEFSLRKPSLQARTKASLFLARHKQEKGRCWETLNPHNNKKQSAEVNGTGATLDEQILPVHLTDSNVQEHLLPVCTTLIPQLCGNSVWSCH